MSILLNTSKTIIRGLDKSSPWLALLFLRILIGWEYLEAGLEKFNGQNWFTDIQSQFPFPFNLVPSAISWQMATWFEIIGGVALIIGLGTRFFALNLIILTIVAISAVHWPADWQTFAELMKGYVISDDGFGNFFHGIKCVFLDRAFAVEGATQAIHHATEQSFAHGHREQLAGGLDFRAFANAEVIAEDDRADFGFFEVEREADDAVAEIQHLIGHTIGEAFDLGDAVRDFADDADVLLVHRRLDAADLRFDFLQ